MSVCVIGGGVMGITTAYQIQKKLPHTKIRIVASSFSPANATDVAAGFWLPHCVGPEQDPKLIDRWSKETVDYIMELMPRNANEYGIGLASTYFVGEGEIVEGGEPCQDLLFNFRYVPKSEMAKFGWTNAEFGEFFTSYYVEGSKYTQKLLTRFQENGGKVVTKHLTSLDDLAVDNYDIIVNCSGLGSFHLIGDKTMFPIRGQVLEIRNAPQVKHNYVYERKETVLDSTRCFALINSDKLKLGGTEQYGDWNLSESAEDTAKIIELGIKHIPGIDKVDSYVARVGLRPGRPSIRLETEMRKVGSRTIPVVHNYGHGGSGLTIFWGCAGDASDLVVKALKDISRSKL